MIDKVHPFFYQQKKYLDGYESFCYQNCLKLLLEAADIAYAPLYINASLGLELYKSEETIEFKTPINSRSFIPSHLDLVSRQTEWGGLDAKDILKENLIEIIEKDKPMIVGVDIYYLGYTPFYRKNHTNHTLILSGADNENVYLTDWYEPWFYNGVMPIETFLKARSSICPYDGGVYSSGHSISNNVTHINYSGLTKKYTAHALLMEILKLSFSQNYEDNEANVGIKAIIGLKEILLHFNNLDNEMKNNLHRTLFSSVKRYNFLKEYLFYYDSVEQDLAINDMILILNEIIESWKLILMLMYKAIIVFSEKTIMKITDVIDSVLLPNEYNLKASIAQYVLGSKLT